MKHPKLCLVLLLALLTTGNLTGQAFYNYYKTKKMRHGITFQVILLRRSVLQTKWVIIAHHSGFIMEKM